MDHGSFDTFARLLGSAGSRRAAIAALLGTGVAGSFAATDAAKKRDRKNNRKNGKKGKAGAQVSAQAADCLSPGSGTNISGCDYTGDVFSGDDLSSSRMVKTIFRNGKLVKTKLQSSNAKEAVFRNADLCGADLSSSTLRGANFRDANLTRADLRSSGGCGSADFTDARFCETILCDGTTDSSDCPVVNPLGLCCDFSDCTGGNVCDPNQNRCCFSNGTNVGPQNQNVCCSGFKCPNNRCRPVGTIC